MEKIHSSHSKKELQEIIEIFDLNVVNYTNMNKKDICNSLIYELSKIDDIKKDDDYFFIKNKTELIEYLINPDSSKSLTIKEKNNVMELAKYIMMYVKNGYYLSQSPFLDWDNMYERVIYISEYGDIPSVRKAVDGFNTDARMIDRDKIQVLMSSRCKKKIERKKRLIQKEKIALVFKRGKYVVDLGADYSGIKPKRPFQVS